MREPDGVDRGVDDPAELIPVAPLFETRPRPFRFVVEKSAQFDEATVPGRQFHGRRKPEGETAAFFFGHLAGTAPGTRPAEEYTVRIIPSRPGVRVPAELPLILCQK